MIARNDSVIISEEKSTNNITGSGMLDPTPRTVYTVVEVGPDVKDLKKGDQVAVAVYANDQFNIGGVKYIIVPQDQVKAVE